tara:strand:+ start:457 stop:1347 length:891 start_codon:yes stop_codon:yes gene_type:complete
MYFKNFPLIRYPNGNGQLELIQDILVRVGFTDQTKSESETFIRYDVPEGHTPERIAEDVYGDQQFFWVVLLFNDFLDPQYSPPLRSRSLDDYTSRKYRSKTLFITPEGITQEFFKHPKGGTSTVSSFREGDTITLYLGSRNKYQDSGVNKVFGIVKKFIPELSAIQLDSLEGTIEAGDTIVRGYDTEIRARVSRVTDSRFAVHHFEKNNITLNPMATPPDSDNQQVPLGQTGDGFSTPVGVTQTILENYMNDNVNTNVITNEEYEFTQNETNRTIRLLSPDLLDSVVREFREIFNT